MAFLFLVAHCVLPCIWPELSTNTSHSQCDYGKLQILQILKGVNNISLKFFTSRIMIMELCNG